ncbi:proline--tRNA ligase [Fimbriiglobus ruber]|uniref:Proline--tRNA ligase n=1 Tax=Fimbriiglobus ruber TaxID=1908690 RepID=A0A225DHN6_9BACT|nr:proline--tRNA ligase [Fimbriiglobus ruber]OWK36956.1 Prolyl-tRNA synthetase [Fimbriiglobus ruber]
MAEKITPRAKDYPQWYLDIVKEAGLADNSDVRGCMVIKPTGYAIWEKMQRGLDKMFKDTGHVNAYFPLFIPMSYLAKEEEMAEGFAKECAVVTHYRLKAEKGKPLHVDPTAELEEPLIIRPTSETIIWRTYKEWIQSYRDLPLLINQWANVVRWEMRTRLFLRTAEFLWQEGHTAHATQAEAEAETLQMVRVYQKFAEEFMAMPVLVGPKSDGQKFPGAIYTLCIEAMMQDGKALQAGTSHFLGQNFAKAFDVTFQNEKGQREHAWATSWGVSTRLIGGIIMTHSDDNGLVVPPRLAPLHVVICPLGKNDAERAPGIAAAEKLAAELRALPRDDFFGYEPISVKVDMTFDKQPGFRYAEYELRGVPVRVEIGPKDLAKSACAVARRDVPGKEGKQFDVPLAGAAAHIDKLLRDIQVALYTRAKKYRDDGMRTANSYTEFKEMIEQPGFVWAHWDGTGETETKIAEETKATIRCIPFDAPIEPGVCMVTGQPSARRVVFARAY